MKINDTLFTMHQSLGRASQRELRARSLEK